jgi:hypothetical protein
VVADSNTGARLFALRAFNNGHHHPAVNCCTPFREQRTMIDTDPGAVDDDRGRLVAPTDDAARLAKVAGSSQASS